MYLIYATFCSLRTNLASVIKADEIFPIKKVTNHEDCCRAMRNVTEKGLKCEMIKNKLIVPLTTIEREKICGSVLTFEMTNAQNF